MPSTHARKSETILVYSISLIHVVIFLQDNAKITIKEPVSQQFARLLIGKHSGNNFRGIERECGVKITWPKFSGTEKHVIFDIIGLRQNCERAREMLRKNQVNIHVVN
jgi:hypothetical protein